MRMVGLYEKFDRCQMAQIAVRVRGQKVCQSGINSLYTLAEDIPWSWKK